MNVWRRAGGRLLPRRWRFHAAALLLGTVAAGVGWLLQVALMWVLVE